MLTPFLILLSAELFGQGVKPQPRTSALGMELQPRATLAARTDKVEAVAFSPDGALLASAGGPAPGSTIAPTVRLWSIPAGHERAVFTRIGASSITNLAFSADGKTLATTTSYPDQRRGRKRHFRDSTVELWDIATGENRVIFTTPHVPFALRYSPNGKTLAISVSEIGILAWDVASERILSTLENGIDFSRDVAFSFDGTMLAAQVAGGIALWNAATWQRQTTLKGNRGNIYCLAFSPNGKFLASGNTDDSVRVWYLFTKELWATLKGFKGSIISVAYSLDSTLLAAGCSDGTFWLFDTKTYAEPLIVRGHKDVVFSVAFSPDGKILATGSADHTIKLWDVAELLKKGPAH